MAEVHHEAECLVRHAWLEEGRVEFNAKLVFVF